MTHSLDQFILPGKDAEMGKGRFLNQKLGKNASRKAGLLKSQLPAYTKRESILPLAPPTRGTAAHPKP
jgi:hypothetical protein